MNSIVSSLEISAHTSHVIELLGSFDKSKKEQMNVFNIAACTIAESIELAK